MSLSAIIYFTLVKPFPQSEDDMLAILSRGNSYYESNMREICQSYPTFFSDNHLSFYTSPSHIRLRNVRIFGHKIVLRTGVDVIGRGVVGRDEENVGLRSIGEVLQAFLGRRPNVAAIAICQSYSRAIMKRTSANDTTTKYYLFDPHQFDSATAFRLPLQGPLPRNDNNAAFVAFDSAESLIWVFTNLVSQFAEDFDAHKWAKWNQSLQLDLTEIGAGLLCWDASVEGLNNKKSIKSFFSLYVKTIICLHVSSVSKHMHLQFIMGLKRGVFTSVVCCWTSVLSRFHSVVCCWTIALSIFHNVSMNMRIQVCHTLVVTFSVG